MMELANRVTLQTFTIAPVLPSTRSTQILHAAYTAAKKVHRARIEKPKESGGACCAQQTGYIDWLEATVLYRLTNERGNDRLYA